MWGNWDERDDLQETYRQSEEGETSQYTQGLSIKKRFKGNVWKEAFPKKPETLCRVCFNTIF